MRVIFDFLISLKFKSFDSIITKVYRVNNSSLRFLWFCREFCHVTHNEASMLHMSFQIFVCITQKSTIKASDTMQIHEKVLSYN